MLSRRRYRVALSAAGLTLCITLLYIRGFAGFAGERERTRPYQPEKPAIIMEALQISSMDSGVLITGRSDAIVIENQRYDRHTRRSTFRKVLRDDPVNDSAVPLLNLQITPDKAAISERIAKQTGEETARESESYRPRVPLVQIMTGQDGELRVRARFIGDVLSQQCDNSGRCLLVLQNDAGGGRPAFYSRDGGLHWQWLQQWTSPESLPRQNVLAITGPGRFVMAQNDVLYQTADFGRTWKMLADLTRPERESTDQGGYQRYHSQDSGWLVAGHYAVSWQQERDPERTYDSGSLACINLQTGRQDATLLLPGRIDKPVSTPDGDIFFIFESSPRTRYSINRLDCSNGTYSPIAETGTDSISDLYAGKNSSLMYTFRFNDPEHVRVSPDGGKSWERMQKFTGSYEENMLFDSVRNRLFYFPAKSYYAPELGNRDGLAYETSPIGSH